MIRHRKTQLAILVAAPLLIFGVGALDYFFSENLFAWVKISYFLGLFLLILFFFRPIHRLTIGEKQPTSTQPFWRWALCVIAIELGTVFLFLLQKQVLLIGLVNGGKLGIPAGAEIIHHLLDDFFVSYYLYPWPWIIVVGIVFAYANTQLSAVAPFSVFISKKITFSFLPSFLKGGMNLYIVISTALFLSINLIAIAYYLCLLIGNRYVLFMPIGTIISSFLLCLFFMRRLARKSLGPQERKISLGRAMMGLLMAIFIMTMISQILTQAILQIYHRASYIDQVRIFQFGERQFIWPLILWSWWMLGIPFISTLLVRVSKGRKGSTFLIGTLVLPMVIYITSGLLTHINIFEHMVLTNWIWLAMNLVGIGFFFVSLFLKGHQTLLQMGGYSLRSITSRRYISAGILWQLSVCLIAFWGIGGVPLLQCSWMLVVLPCFIVLMLFVLWGVFRSEPLG